MNKETILEMEPGFKLDSLVAEKVMGWTQSSYTGFEPDWMHNNCVMGEVGEWCPSTNIEEAWEVYEWLVEKYNDTILTYPWTVSVDYDPMREDPWRLHAEGETAPLAICRAALLATLEANHET